MQRKGEQMISTSRWDFQSKGNIEDEDVRRVKIIREARKEKKCSEKGEKLNKPSYCDFKTKLVICRSQ